LLVSIHEHYLQRIQSAGLSGDEVDQLSQQLTKLAGAFAAIEDISC